MREWTCPLDLDGSLGHVLTHEGVRMSRHVLTEKVWAVASRARVCGRARGRVGGLLLSQGLMARWGRLRGPGDA